MYFSITPGNVLMGFFLRYHQYAPSICRSSWFSRLHFCYDHTKFRKKPSIEENRDGSILKNQDDLWQHNAW